METGLHRESPAGLMAPSRTAREPKEGGEKDPDRNRGACIDDDSP